MVDFRTVWSIFWGIIFFGIVLLLIGGLIYLEFFKCGGMSGTMADIPRYCWWLR